MEIWLKAFQSILIPMAGLLAMVIMGVIIAKLKVLDEEGTGTVTRLLVALLLPLMIFTNIVEHFQPWSKEYAGWYLLPVSALVLTTVGYALGWLTHALLGRPQALRRIMFATMCGWQNAGYIAIPLVYALFAGATRDQMLVYLFLFILGMSPTQWSIVPYNVMRASQRTGERIEWRRLLTPPFIANISAITLCMIGLPQLIDPKALTQMLTPLKAVGDTTVPIIMVLLGAMLTQTKGESRLGPRFALGLIFVKLILLPAIMMCLLMALSARWEINRGIAAIILLQTAVPPATGLVVIGRRYGSPEVVSLINQAIIWSYLAALITLPAWLALGQMQLDLFAP